MTPAKRTVTMTVAVDVKYFDGTVLHPDDLPTLIREAVTEYLDDMTNFDIETPDGEAATYEVVGLEVTP